MYRCFWLIYMLCELLYWVEVRETPWIHKYGEYEWLKLWWQLYIMSLPEWNWTKFQTAWFLLYVLFWVISWHLNFICRRFGTLCLFHLHRQVGVEMSAYKIQTPGNYPEENTQHTEHGKSLKSRTLDFCWTEGTIFFFFFCYTHT